MSCIFEDNAPAKFSKEFGALRVVKQAREDVKQKIYPFLLEKFNSSDLASLDNFKKKAAVAMIEQNASIFSFYLALWHVLEEYYTFLENNSSEKKALVNRFCLYFKNYAEKIVSTPGRGWLARNRETQFNSLILLINGWLSQNFKQEDAHYQDEISRLLYLLLMSFPRLVSLKGEQKIIVDDFLTKTEAHLETLYKSYEFSERHSLHEKELFNDLFYFNRTLCSMTRRATRKDEHVLLTKIKEQIDYIEKGFLTARALDLTITIKKHNNARSNTITKALNMGLQNDYSESKSLDLPFEQFMLQVKKWQAAQGHLISALSSLNKVIVDYKTQLYRTSDCTAAITIRNIETLETLSHKLTSHFAKNIKLSPLEFQSLSLLNDYQKKVLIIQNNLKKRLKECELLSQQGKVEVGVAVSIGIAFGEIMELRSHWNKKLLYHCYFYLVEPLYRHRVQAIEQAYQKLKLSKIQAFGIKTGIQQEKRNILNNDQELPKSVQESIGGLFTTNNFNYCW